MMNIKTIFILRTDNIGDVLLFSGCLEYYRKHFRNAKITICVLDKASPLLKNCPHVDRIVKLSELDFSAISKLRYKSKYLDNPISRIADGGYRKFRFLMQRYDMAICPVKSPTSFPSGMHGLMKAINAGVKIGIDDRAQRSRGKADEAADSIYSNMYRLNKEAVAEHDIVTNVKFMDFLGIKHDGSEVLPAVWIAEADREKAERVVKFGDNLPIIGMCPASSVSWKRTYPIDKYDEISERLKGVDFNAIICGSREEKDFNAKIEAKLLTHGRGVINTTGNLNIMESIACLEKCDIIYSMETGMAHAGIALGKPTVCVLGGGHFGRFFPYPALKYDHTICKKMDCFNCDWNCRYKSIKCIQEIEPERIAERLRELLNELR